MDEQATSNQQPAKPATHFKLSPKIPQPTPSEIKHKLHCWKDQIVETIQDFSKENFLLMKKTDAIRAIFLQNFPHYTIFKELGVQCVLCGATMVDHNKLKRHMHEITCRHPNVEKHCPSLFVKEQEDQIIQQIDSCVPENIKMQFKEITGFQYGSLAPLKLSSEE